MKKLRLGLVGCGNMMASHVKASNEIKNLEVTAVCDIIRENAQKVHDVLDSKPKVYTNYREMLDDVDAVMIALPHDLHFECGMFFAAHDKHILMEKPLCNSERECEVLIETCEKRNLKLMCAYPVRFWPGVVKLKELLDTGDYGEIIQMSIWTEQLTGLGRGVDNPDRVSWGYSARVGGGQLFSHGCHYIDVLLWFLGEPVSGSHLGTRNGTPWMLEEGTSAVIMKFKNGALGYHGATWGARGSKLRYDFQVQTEKGLLEYDHVPGEIKFYNKSNSHQPNADTESAEYHVLWTRDFERTKSTQYEMRHFTECVLEDKTPITDGKKAIQSLRVIWSLYNAEKNGFVADLRGLGLENA